MLTLVSSDTFQTQLDHLQHVVSSSDRIVRLRRQLDELDQAEAQCIAYDIPVPLLPLSSASPLSIAENETHETSTSKSSERRSRVDTIHSASGLRNEFEQLEKQLTNKISFIENQVRSVSFVLTSCADALPSCLPLPSSDCRTEDDVFETGTIGRV